jgi:colanic acid biosynthesis glycosyl transferase WcaI
MYGRFAAAVWHLASRGDRIIVKTDPPMLSVALFPVARIKKLLLVNWLKELYPELALGACEQLIETSSSANECVIASKARA